MNIHQLMKEQYELAKIYAQDGAFHTAAGILRGLANDMEEHARFCDKAVAGLMKKHRAASRRNAVREG
jgi:hypothetical protein